VFIVERKGYSKEARYIQSIELNGKALNRNYITHDEIIAGGKLSFKMGTKQSAWY